MRPLHYVLIYLAGALITTIGFIVTAKPLEKQAFENDVNDLTSMSVFAGLIWPFGLPFGILVLVYEQIRKLSRWSLERKYKKQRAAKITGFTMAGGHHNKLKELDEELLKIKQFDAGVFKIKHQYHTLAVEPPEIDFETEGEADEPAQMAVGGALFAEKHDEVDEPFDEGEDGEWKTNTGYGWN